MNITGMMAILLIVFWKLYDIKQARMLLKSLVIVGAIIGSVLGIGGTCVPWLFPNIFTPDQKIIQEVGFFFFFWIFLTSS